MMDYFASIFCSRLLFTWPFSAIYVYKKKEGKRPKFINNKVQQFVTWILCKHYRRDIETNLLDHDNAPRAILTTTHNGSINFEHFTACLGKFVQTDVSAFVEDKGGGIRSF